jgi:hypothetical protein
MIASSIVMSIGYGLISTWTVDAPSSHWLGYQALAGIGVGLGMQQPLMAVQNVLDISDVPVGTSLLIFLQTLGGALFASVAQNIFTNKLVEGLSEIPGLNPLIVLSVGATSIQEKVPEQFLRAVIEVYNTSLVTVFKLATAMAAVSIVGALSMEWRSMKGKKVEMAIA